jgi:AcrR family transcriptional regulator
VAEEAPSDTRVRILRAALDAFAARGYHATSVREIAERVGVTKTAVLYHFPTKADILGALAEPMLDALDAAVAAADMADARDARWIVIEGVLEVCLSHRYLMRMSLHDLALVAAGPVFERFRDAMMRANALVAGPRPDFADRVRAAQAIAMLGDPVVLFADAPTDTLRTTVLQGVRRLLDGGDSQLDAAAPTGAPGQGPQSHRLRSGRPSVMSPAMAETARRMYDAGHNAAEIAAEIGVSRATVYRHLASIGH